MEEKSFDFMQLVEDSKNALLKPKEYFPTLKLEGGLAEPVIKAAIYGALAGFLYVLWSIVHIGAIVGMFGGIGPVGIFFLSIIGAVVGLFISGIVILIISSICGGNTNFEANVRVASAIMIVFPVSAFLTIFSGLNYYIGTLIGLALNLYTLYMLFIAITTVLKGSEKTAKILAYVLAGLLFLFLIIGLGAYIATKKIVGYSDEKIEQVLKDLEEADEPQDVDEVDDKFKKPESFPSDACEKFADNFYKTDPVLSQDLLLKLVNATEAIKEYDKSQSEEILATLNVNGFESMEQYSSSLMNSIYGSQALGGLVAVQTIIESSKEEQKAAEAFTLDQAMNEMVKQMVNAGKLTEKDMHILYDNWDLKVKIDKLTKK